MSTEQRKHPRQTFSRTGIVFGTDGKLIVRCDLRDVSVSGAQFVLEREATLPRRFILAMSQDGKVRRSCTLAWQFSIMAGAKFDSEHQTPAQAGKRR